MSLLEFFYKTSLVRQTLDGLPQIAAGNTDVQVIEAFHQRHRLLLRCPHSFALFVPFSIPWDHCMYSDPSMGAGRAKVRAGGARKMAEHLDWGPTEHRVSGRLRLVKSALKPMELI